MQNSLSAAFGPVQRIENKFSRNLVRTDRSAIKRYTKQNPNIKIHPLDLEKIKILCSICQFMSIHR